MDSAEKKVQYVPKKECPTVFEARLRGKKKLKTVSGNAAVKNDRSYI